LRQVELYRKASTKPHVVLEGPDGSGKTTFAEYLVNTHGYSYHHQGPPQHDDMLREYAIAFLNALEHCQLCAFDRLHLGESVYGPLLRGRDRVGGKLGTKLLDMLIQAKGGQVFLCLPPYERIKESWIRRREKELVQDLDLLEKTYTEYLRLVRNLDYRLLNYAIEDSFLALHQIVNTPVPCVDGDFIGNPLAQFIFVGDRANQTLDLPFFATDGSSKFFWDTIDAARYRRTEILVTNSRDPEGEVRNPKDWLNKLYPSRRTIVALGQDAAKVVYESVPDNMETNIYVVDHPQYIKRFKSKQVDDYVKFFEHIKHGAPTQGIQRLLIR
jgi:hypothetical protein